MAELRSHSVGKSLWNRAYRLYVWRKGRFEYARIAAHLGYSTGELNAFMNRRWNAEREARLARRAA